MNPIKIMNSIVIIIALYTSGFTQEKMRIAILDLKPEGVSVQISKVVSNMLRSDLINLGNFTVVERSQMDKILKEQGFQQTGCTDQECAVELGRLMSTKKILIGEISPLGNEIIISVRIVDVEKGVAEYSAREKSHSVNQLDQAITELTEKLSNRILNIESAPKERIKYAESARDTKKGEKQQKSDIAEGWVSPDIFRVKATGAPKTGSEGVQRRETAKESAQANAKNKIIEKFIRARSENVHINTPDYQFYESQLNVEFSNLVKGGTIVTSTFDDDDNCKIVYQVEKKNLRKEVEKSNIEPAPKERIKYVESTKDTKKDEKQQRLDTAEGWVSPDIFRVKAIGAPNGGSQDVAERRNTALENAVKMAKRKMLEKFCTERLKKVPTSHIMASDIVPNAISLEFGNLTGTIVNSSFDDDDNCKIIYQIEKKNLKKQVETGRTE